MLIFPEVLLYHRIASDVVDNQYLSVHPDNFEEHLIILSQERRVLPLFDLVQAACKGHLVEQGVAITFDDGYADNLLTALPLLEKYRCHATIFVTAGMVGHPYGFWYDVLEDVLLRGRALPDTLPLALVGQTLPLGSPEEILVTHDLLLDWCKKSPARLRRLLLHEVVLAAGLDPAAYVSPHPVLTQGQVAALAASPWVEVGAHTLTHPVLSLLNEAEQRNEITGSARLLETMTGKSTRILAYPFGNREAYNDMTRRVTREAGLLGIANIQAGLSLPLDPQNVPRRLVRNWTRAQFRRWLRAADRSQLERETVGGRMDMLRRHLAGTVGIPASAARAAVVSSSRPLHITHINTMLGKGGTAGIMQLLQEVQNAAGHESRMLSGRLLAAKEGGATFDTVPDTRAEVVALREGLTDYHFQGSHMLALHPQVRHADVLHFHNLHGGYCNPWSLAGLTRLCPSVWTLHDMHALTGHCAHAFDCPRWQTGCGLCPDLKVYPAVPVDNTHRLWRDKQRIYSCSPVRVVVPSQWLARHVEKSMLAGHPLTVIPNGIDIRIFAPQDKRAARARLGIAPDALVVGSAAYNGPLHNFWKGGAFALEALEALRGRYPDVLFLGRGNAQEGAVPNVRLLPYAFNEQDMADFYATLDVMLYPSLADNCPLVVMEAMACGIPVLAFDVGGIPELVAQEGCGVLVPSRDGEALCRAALELAGDAEARRRMGHAARQRAEAAFDARLMARRYEAVYAEAMETWRQLPQARATLAQADVPAFVRGKSFKMLADKAGLWAGGESPAKEAGCESFRTEPVSRVFGLDRPGSTPVDRVYIERFLAGKAASIRGRVLEIAEDTYTRKFGRDVGQSDVLHTQASPEATIVGDLATGEGIPRNAFDCIILTQTIQFIYEVKAALATAMAALAPGGTLLLTASGISQISRYDMDRWGEFWRFTDKALLRLLQEVAPTYAIEVQAFGNAGTARAFLDGRSATELPPAAFDHNDNDYQVTLCARVIRPLEETMQNSVVGDDWKEITVPDDMHGLYDYARLHRYGRYRVHFRGMVIHCIDLLSFYMAGKDIFLQGIYDFSCKTENPFVIDGGGHIGLFTLRAKQLHPQARILAFEPDAQARALFEMNLAANGIEGVDVVSAGLHDSDGMLSFSSRGDDGNTLFGDDSNTTVQVTRLSRHLRRPVDFVKLNIEGGEWPVLSECADYLCNVAQLVLEYHGFPELGDRLHLILDLLHRHGFRYMIHDFDAQTNAASKPPFHLDAETRYFLLVAARRLEA